MRLRDGDGALDADGLAGLPAAIRTRVLHAAAVAAGCPAGSLTAGHVAGLDALVTDWHGQRWADLPGGRRGLRRYGKLIFTAGQRAGSAPRPQEPQPREPRQPEHAENAEGAGGRD
jgi:tRNA(Ile)-lysidine synthase